MAAPSDELCKEFLRKIPLVREVFKLENEDSTFRIEDSFKFNYDHIPNIYTYDEQEGTFAFVFAEKGVRVTLETESLEGKREFTITYLRSCPIVDGVNFVGELNVTHPSGETARIFLPGARTYDPAGITGHPHASERIGPDCFASQTAITVAQIYAIKVGCPLKFIKAMQKNSLPVIEAFHERFELHEYMHYQVVIALLEKKQPMRYCEFLKEKIGAGSLNFDSKGHEHSKEYMHRVEDYVAGKADFVYPPFQFFQKIDKADDKEGALMQLVGKDCYFAFRDMQDPEKNKSRQARGLNHMKTLEDRAAQLDANGGQKDYQKEVDERLDKWKEPIDKRLIELQEHQKMNERRLLELESEQKKNEKKKCCVIF
mmetsp:Transcript_53634/g.61480  ORF Transcript_53634/g.61480 Transcript_53634/m.61480 type:complete len:371 (+) Transcript_53634:1145-2257(+)|eukprot:CAMPEP_0114975456 /NCGR_PEP_ID=MMETSP0216-20121206/2108_1 /TAXON_ID=223996 /ORGANISM="Protocruzia adherens, Strain Boccale" /LENGTH=370 /DNA_ID=CAMNT_0002336237 /DNA_START=2786 /DNA_END=3898 /DNA_ORIENTATION=+